MQDNREITEDKPIIKVGRPRKYETVRALTMAINKYLANTEAPNKAGLAFALGFVAKDALNYYRELPEFSDLVNMTFLYIEQFWTERLLYPQSTGATFWLKNNAGYVDKQEIRTKAQEISEFTPEEVARLRHWANLADGLTVHREAKEA